MVNEGKNVGDLFDVSIAYNAKRTVNVMEQLTCRITVYSFYLYIYLIALVPHTHTLKLLKAMCIYCIQSIHVTGLVLLSY